MTNEDLTHNLNVLKTVCLEIVNIQERHNKQINGLAMCMKVLLDNQAPPELKETNN